MMSVDLRRSVVSGVLGLLMVLGATPALAQTEPGPGFTDDDGNIHEANIEFILAAGITKGCNPPVNDHYCPGLPVSRAQLASFMARAFSLPASTTDHFTDDDASVHEDDINAIADAGFVFGCGSGLYCPDDDVTRAQLASVFVRAFEFPASTTDFFVDDDSSIHEDDINALAEVGVTLGCSVDPANFCPFDPVLRDQFASFMTRALTLPSNEPPVADATAVTIDEDTPVEITLSGTDPNGDLLTYTLETAPASGTLTSVGLPALTYTPDADFFGVDQFTFAVSDGEFTSATAAVDVTVVAANDAPILDALGNQSVDELTSLGFLATAVDVDAGDTLAYSLDAGPPAGMSIDPVTGVLEWTPTEAQGPGVYSVTLRVTDDGVPVLDDFETLDITVGEANESPVLGAIGDQAVDELVSLGLTATATDVDLPANGLTFSVDAGAPSGISIDTASGVFEWTPTESQGPGVFSVTVRVTDDGTPVLSDFETFGITVSETNEAPVLGDIGDQSVDELVSLGFTATAIDVDLPSNDLAFSLDGASITTGMTIDPVTGVFEWTPTEAQGPGVFPVTVTVTDDGTPALSDSETLDISVGDVNVSPVLDPIGDQSVDELASLGFTAAASDADVGDTLAFSLDAASVTAGMSIDPVSGVFEWTPTEAQGPGVFPVTVTVTDDGTPVLDDAETVDITVNEANVAPVAAAQNYDAIGNVPIVVPGASGLLIGATDADAPPQVLSIGTFDAATTGGGAVNAVDTDTGAFTYAPAAGFTGADTFTYTVVDDLAASSVAATVTITVTDVIWFIDNSDTGADNGTLADPFQSIGAFNTSGDVTANDHVYLAETGTDYTAGIVLDNGQTLTGEGASGASLDAVLGITLPAHSAALPAIGGASPLIQATGAGVTLASGNEIRGIDIATTSGVGLTGASVGALVVADMTIATTGNAAILLSGGSGVSIDIDAVAVTGSASGGINLTSMPGTTDLGAVNITTTGGTGLIANNAGTLNITGSANTIDSTNGPAVSVTGGTTIGTSGITLQSVSATAASSGIVLNNTGTGAFTVTGDGASSPIDLTRGVTGAGAGSGGTIADSTGDSVQLTNASNVTLQSMVISNNNTGSRRGISLNGGAALTIDNTLITGFSDDGINVSDLAGLTITHSEIETNAKSPDSVANDESNVTLDDVSGVALVQNTLIRDVHQDNVRISSCESAPCGGTDLTITFDNVAVSDTLAGAGGNNGITVRSFNDADVSLIVVDSEFTDNRANGIQHNTNGSSSGATDVSDSTFYGETVDINIAHQGTTHTFNLVDNTIRNQLGTVAHNGNAVNVFLGGTSTGASVLSGTISGNTIGNGGIADSGSLFGNGIDLFASGDGTLTSNVTGNTVRGIQFGSAFRAISSDHNGTINLTAKSNTFDVTPTAAGFALGGLDLTAGTLAADTGAMCADISGNTSFVGDPLWAGASITAIAGSPTIQLVGYVGADNDLTAIETFLDSAAATVTPSAIGSLTTTLSAGTVTGVPGSCPQP
jgi:hypothetical protein